MLSNEPKPEPIAVDIQFWTEIINQWIKLPQEGLSRLSEDFIKRMRHEVEQYAKFVFADTRTHEIAPIAERCLSRSTHVAVKIAVFIVGAMAYTSGVRIYTAPLGNASLPVSLLGGLFASYFVDFLATGTLFGLRKRLSTDECLKNLRSQKQIALEPEGEANTNEFVPTFFNQESQLCRKIEGSNLMRKLPVNALLGCSLSIIEFVLAFSIVRQVGIFDDFPVFLTGVASLLPVLLTWAASAYQSASYKLPEYYADLIPQYEDVLVELHDPQLVNYWKQKSYECGRLDAQIQFVLGGYRSDKAKDIHTAGYDFDIRYYKEQVKKLEEEHAEERLRRVQEFNRECRNLDREAMTAIPPANLKNLSDGGAKKEQDKVEEKRRKWIEQEREKRARPCQEDLDLIHVYYQDRIQRQQQEIDRAEADYQAALENWNRENCEE